MDTPTDEQGQALSFSVSYALREYLSFVQDHLPVVLQAVQAERGKPARRPSWLARSAVVVAAFCMFPLKKRRMPVCHFRIDAEAIRRETADGCLTIRWTEVVAVYAYTQGYLVDKGKGAVPLPYRCFGPRERLMFEDWRRLWEKRVRRES